MIMSLTSSWFMQTPGAIPISAFDLEIGLGRSRLDQEMEKN